GLRPRALRQKTSPTFDWWHRRLLGLVSPPVMSRQMQDYTNKTPNAMSSPFLNFFPLFPAPSRPRGAGPLAEEAAKGWRAAGSSPARRRRPHRPPSGGPAAMTSAGPGVARRSVAVRGRLARSHLTPWGCDKEPGRPRDPDRQVPGPPRGRPVGANGMMP